MVEPGGEVLYRLNDRDEIVFVNAAWDTFAEGNGSKHLTSAGVLGRSLWGFVSDPTTQQLYRDILVRVRAGWSARFTFRCDSPTRRRLLEMGVSRGPEGAAEFRVWVLAEEERPSQPLLDPHQPRSDELVRVCGWCKRVDAGGRWAEVEEAVAALGLFERPVLPRLTHGMCDDCYARVTKALGPRDER